MSLRSSAMFDNREFWALSIASTFRSVGMGATYPYISIYFSDVEHVPVYVIGIIFSLMAVVSLVMSIVGGAIGDMFGRRSAIVIGSIVGIACYTLLAFFSSGGTYVLAIMITFIASQVAGGLIFPASSALVADVTSTSGRRHAYSVYRIAINIGWSIGPIIGGIIYPLGIWILFLIIAVTSLIQLILSTAFIGEHVSASPQGSRIRARDFIVRDRGLFLFGFGTLLLMMVSSQFLVTFPLFSHEALGINTYQLGIIYAVNGLVVVVGQAPLTKLFSGRSDLFLMGLGAAFYSIGYLLVGYSTGFLDLVFDMIIITVGEDLVSPALNTVVSRIAPKDKLARYMGFSSMMNQIARSISPSVGSYFLAIYSFNGPRTWISISTFGLFAVMVLYYFARTDPRIRGENSNANNPQ
ncbi:MAG: MFS transporter [Candidatus Thermoplasmatota archaeon]|nr:MFS transporter [Candidatus Thermoplasmatota archaeon]